MTHEEGEGLADMTEELHDALTVMAQSKILADALNEVLPAAAEAAKPYGPGPGLEDAIAAERRYLKSLMNHPCGAKPEDLP